MSLGDAFPESLRQASVERQIVPRAIIKLKVEMDDRKIHEKIFIVIDVDDETMTLVINTAIAKIIKSSEDLLKCQVAMKASDHECLDHDSFVDCSRARAYPVDEVRKQLNAKPEWILGVIEDDFCNEIKNGMKHSKFIAPINLVKYCNSLDSH